MPEWQIGDRVYCLRKPGFAHAYGKIGTVIDYDDTPGLYSKYAVEVETESGLTLVPVAGHELRPAPPPELAPADAAGVLAVLGAAGLRAKHTRSNGTSLGFEATVEDTGSVLVRFHATAAVTGAMRIEQCALALEGAGFEVRRISQRRMWQLVVTRRADGGDVDA